MRILRAQNEPTGPLQTISCLLLKAPIEEDSLSWTESVCSRLLPAVRKKRLAASINLEYDSTTLPQALALKITGTARAFGFHVHLSSGQAAGTSAVHLAVESRALSVTGFRALGQNQISTLAESPTVAVFTPGVTFQLGMQFPGPGRAMVDAGVVPGLASAYHPELSPGFDMQLMILLSHRLYGFTPEEAISAATINNAHALRKESLIGSIETGKQADVLVLGVADYHEIGYYPSINIVEKVFKRGMLVYDRIHDAELH